MNPPIPKNEDVVPSIESLLGRCAVGGFIVVFSLIWTVVSVGLDLVIAHRMAEDFPGDLVYLVMFGISFNASLILLWSVLVPQALLPNTRSRWWHGPGIQILDDGDEVRFRLPRIPPIFAALLAAFLSPFIGLLLAAGMMGLGNPPWLVAAIVTALVLGTVVTTYVILARRIGAGECDLIIHRSVGIMALPLTFGRSQRVVLPCADLIGIRVVTAETKDGEGNITWVHAVTVQWHGIAGQLHDAKLAELTHPDRAEDLAYAIRRVATSVRDTVSGKSNAESGDFP